jgi:radical SAM protein
MRGLITMTNPIRSLHTDVDDRPFIVIWEVTRACALACAHCRADALPCRDPRELSTEAGIALLDDLASYGPPRPMVVLTGGDPFEREDLVDLVAHGTAAGLHLSLSPSVTPRLTIDALRALRAAGAHAVSLSLDGASPDTHDAFRGIDGTFEATMAAASAVREAGLRLQINTTVTSGNVAELPDLLDLVADMDPALWSVFFLVPTGRGRRLKPLPAGEVEQVMWWLHEVSGVVPVKTTEAPHFRRIAIQRAENPLGAAPAGALLEELRRRTTVRTPPSPARSGPSGRSRPPLDVNAGRGFAFIDHVGTVQPSGFLPLPVGSVAERPFSSIYREAPLFLALRDPDALGGRCGRCEFRTVCGGSRSHAFAVSGNPLAEDPACSYEPRQLPEPAASGPSI